MKNILALFMAFFIVCLYSPASHAADSPPHQKEFVVSASPDMPVAPVVLEYTFKAPDVSDNIPIALSESINYDVILKSVFQPPLNNNWRYCNKISRFDSAINNKFSDLRPGNIVNDFYVRC